MNPVLDGLNSDDPQIRRQAIERAPQHADEAVVSRLKEIVAEPDMAGDNREAAAAALGAIGSPEASRSLLELMRAQDEDLRGLAVIGLGRLKTPQAVSALLEALSDKINTVRNLAERSLLSMPEQVRREGVEPLLQLLQHPVPLTRSPAARLLGLTGDDRALGPLVSMLRQDKQWLARMWAAKGLGDLGNPRALEPLADALQHDEKNRVRAAAAEAVGKLRAPQSQSLLKEALKDEDGGVRRVAEEALSALAQADFAHDGDEPASS